MRTRAVHMSRVLTLAFLILTMGLEAARPSNAASENTKHAPLKKVADIPMPGPAVRFDYQSLDATQGRLYISHMNANQLVVFDTNKREVVAIDPVTMRIIGRYPVTGVKSPHGIALDLSGRLAFVAGEENHMLAVVDLNTMKVVATHPVGEDPDVLAFDPGLKRLYVSAESGNVFVFREDGKTLIHAGDISIPHAHTVCVDPNTHLVYFPLENIDGHPLLRTMEPTTTQ